MFRSIFHPLAWGILLVVYAGFTLISCPTQPTNPPDPATLVLEYTTCTEVWLRVTLPDSTDHAGLRVYRGDSLLVNFPVAPMDTVLIDTGLQPNTTYAYHTARLQDDHEQSPSQPLSVTTLPTTSHNFTWTIDTLGNYGSFLNDVAIVDEDNIWVVGNIETDSMEYNAARWDGEQWHLMGIYSNTLDLHSIQFFASDDIWVTSHCFPYHWDGNTWTQYHLNNMGFAGACAGNAIWGTSSSNLYFVGDEGTIVHYDGQTFTKVSSETDINLTDIYGGPNGASVWACGFDELTGSVLVKQHGSGFQRVNEVTSQTTLGQPGVISHVYQSLWTDNSTVLFLAATGRVYEVPAFSSKKVHSLIWWEGSNEQYPPLSTTISGTGANDLFVAGYFSLLRHFNGVSWANVASAFPAGATWYKIRANRSDVVVVGTTSKNEAVIVRGIR